MRDWQRLCWRAGIDLDGWLGRFTSLKKRRRLVQSSRVAPGVVGILQAGLRPLLSADGHGVEAVCQRLDSYVQRPPIHEQTVAQCL